MARETEKDTNRLEAFSDGVFAIAITLLVLDLKVPPFPKVITPGSLAADLGGIWPSYITFVLSFATILIMWIYHHRLFQSVRRAETVLLFSNGLLLLLVTAVPFPTALVAAYLMTPAASVACAVYAGFFVLINLSYNLLWWVVLRQQTGQYVQGRRISMSRLFALLGFPCYLTAMVVAFWLPWLSLVICGALWAIWAFIPPPPQPQS